MFFSLSVKKNLVVWHKNIIWRPTWSHFDTLGGVHMLSSLLFHLTEPGCRLSGEALLGFEICSHPLHDPTNKIICEYGIWKDIMPVIITIQLHFLPQYLWTLLQHLVFKSLESFLYFGITQRERQEVRERLLLPETLDKNLNSGDSRWDCGFMGTCDNCWTKEESLEITLCCPESSPMLLILTNLSFYSWFWDADIRLCVELQTSACFSFLPNDVPV